MFTYNTQDKSKQALLKYFCPSITIANVISCAFHGIDENRSKTEARFMTQLKVIVTCKFNTITNLWKVQVTSFVVLLLICP